MSYADFDVRPSFITFALMLKEILLVATGGAVGSVARYLMARIPFGATLAQYPLGTLAANILGCLLIGFVSELGQREGAISAEMKIMLTTGFCGGFTTFSTFMNESLNTAKTGSMIVAAAYIAVSIILGLAAAAGGAQIAKAL